MVSACSRVTKVFQRRQKLEVGKPEQIQNHDEAPTSQENNSQALGEVSLCFLDFCYISTPHPQNIFQHLILGLFCILDIIQEYHYINNYDTWKIKEQDSMWNFGRTIIKVGPGEN